MRVSGSAGASRGQAAGACDEAEPHRCSTSLVSITQRRKVPERGSGRNNTTEELELPHELAVGSLKMTTLV